MLPSLSPEKVGFELGSEDHETDYVRNQADILGVDAFMNLMTHNDAINDDATLQQLSKIRVHLADMKDQIEAHSADDRNRDEAHSADIKNRMEAYSADIKNRMEAYSANTRNRREAHSADMRNRMEYIEKALLSIGEFMIILSRTLNNS